ncbi:hypothetical protein [Scopulibacillus cellulosilyticus]|uniref:Uncharacterized protein n=1 Tax=Scopulibacillus cellulosilyticus TaxID=2665665 RepID=A0ABW2PRW5_9BACL
MPRSSRRGSCEDRIVVIIYVRTGAATQRRNSPAIFPGLFKQPLK